MSSFVLDKRIFNPSLYKQLQDVWFEGVDLGAQNLDQKVVQRWFMASPEEKVVFDGVCRDNFGHALEAIGPDKFPNPNAEPFLRQLQDLMQEHPEGDGAEVAWTTLSMVLLLDQMSRNIFRTNEGLAKVYGHYDRISFSLAKTLLSPESPIARPDLHPQWRLSVPHRTWFYLPLLHSEQTQAHDWYDGILAKFEEDMTQQNGSDDMKQFLQQAKKAEKEHREILDRFGRYPHRNAALGRETTVEEKQFLEEGGATFGVAQDK